MRRADGIVSLRTDVCDGLLAVIRRNTEIICTRKNSACKLLVVVLL